MRLWAHGMVGLWDCGPMGWRAYGIVGSCGMVVRWARGILGLRACGTTES